MHSDDERKEQSVELAALFENMVALWRQMQFTFQDKHKRTLPIGDYFVNRWDKAKAIGFAEGASIYDNSLVLGDVKVGENSWIGPFTVLDGSGGLVIGSHCSISAGVQIYTHDSVQWAISGGKSNYEYAPVNIGNNCYIGPNTIIVKGVTIGEGCIIGAGSLVLKSISPHSKAYGSPCKVVQSLK